MKEGDLAKTGSQKDEFRSRYKANHLMAFTFGDYLRKKWLRINTQ